jgi:ABC-type Mn2+/Zn2+ transport system permease subunit
VTGIVVSFVANSPPSATIVMVLIGVFVATLVAKYSSKRRMEEKLEAAKS